ncbi:MAG TPA: metal-dependent transcriptional regulator, partial [Enterococcus cecorum]|nr:metal-dependent transcriptional regulator [Enterococcus cecorum]
NKLEAFMNFPDYCPHGGRIPKENGIISEKKRQTLADYPVGSLIRIARVLDEKELLDYLVSLDLNLQEEYRIIDIADYEGPVTIQNQEKTIAVSFKAASTIFVDLLNEE